MAAVLVDTDVVSFLGKGDPRAARYATDLAGRPIECGDAWIAATAIRYGLPLLTHNARLTPAPWTHRYPDLIGTKPGARGPERVHSGCHPVTP